MSRIRIELGESTIFALLSAKKVKEELKDLVQRKYGASRKEVNKFLSKIKSL